VILARYLTGNLIETQEEGGGGEGGGGKEEEAERRRRRRKVLLRLSFSLGWFETAAVCAETPSARSCLPTQLVPTLRPWFSAIKHTHTYTLTHRAAPTGCYTHSIAFFTDRLSIVVLKRASWVEWEALASHSLDSILVKFNSSVGSESVWINSPHYLPATTTASTRIR